MTVSIVGVAASVLLAAVPVLAHHAFASEFDVNLPVTLQGKITKVMRVNPHGWIFVDVEGPDGQVVNWAIETGTPSALARRGVKKSTLPIGMEILLTGWRAKDGSATANGADIRLPDGQTFLVGTVGTGSPLDERAR